MRRVKIYGYFLKVTYNIQYLTLPLLIEAHVLSQESERSCICVLGVQTLPLSTIFLLDIGTVTVR